MFRELLIVHSNHAFGFGTGMLFRFANTGQRLADTSGHKQGIADGFNSDSCGKNIPQREHLAKHPGA